MKSLLTCLRAVVMVAGILGAGASAQTPVAQPSAAAPPAAPPTVPIARLSETELAGAARAEIGKLVAADAFAGAVLVTRGDQQLFAGAYGMADRARSVRNTLDTRFRNGSMNKMFTAKAGAAAGSIRRWAWVRCASTPRKFATMRSA